MADRHGSREIEIFNHFAVAAGLAQCAYSVERRHPPEPDLLYRVVGSEAVAFELVELIDQDYAGLIGSQLKLKRLFEDSYTNIEISRKAEIERRAGNTLVHVTYARDATFRAKHDAIGDILDVLADIDGSFAGELTDTRRSDLPTSVESILVTRLDSMGPFFDVDAVSSLADPTVDSIRRKLSKVYSSAYPIELLAYYELQPEAPEWFWRPELESLLRAGHESNFRRVWVFDCGARAVRYSSAPVTTGQHEA